MDFNNDTFPFYQVLKVSGHYVSNIDLPFQILFEVVNNKRIVLERQQDPQR